MFLNMCDKFKYMKSSVLWKLSLCGVKGLERGVWGNPTLAKSSSFVAG